MRHVKYLLICILVNVLYCLSSYGQDAIYVYRNDGQFNVFFTQDIDSIVSDQSYDLDNTNTSQYVQHIWTKDSVYTIPVEVIDSISFVKPENKIKRGVITIEGELRSHLIKIADGVLVFDKALVECSTISVGDILVTTEMSPTIPAGFKGRVLSVNNKSDQIEIVCEDVEIEEVYDSYCCIINGSAQNNDKNLSKALRANSNENGYFNRTFNIPTLSHTWGLEIANDNLFSVSNSITSSLTPTINIKGCDIVDPERGHITDLTIVGDYTVTNSFDLSVGASERKETSFPLGKLEEPIAPFLSFFIDSGLFFEVSANVSFSQNISSRYKSYFNFKRVGDSMNPVVSYVQPISEDKSSMKLALKGRIAGGVYIEAGVKPIVIDKNLLGKVSGRFDLGIEAKIVNGFDSNDLKQASLNTALYDIVNVADGAVNSNLTIGLYAAITGNVRVTPWQTTWTIWKGQIGTPFYQGGLFPHFSDIEYTRNGSSNSITCKCKTSRTCPVDYSLGYAVFDSDGQKLKTVYCSTPYSITNQFPSYSLDISGIQRNKKHVIYPCINIFGYDVLGSPSLTVNDQFEVRTVASEEITKNSATLVGYVKGKHNTHGFRYSTSKDNWTFVDCIANSEGNYGINIGGLTPNTTYYYSAFIDVDGEISYGEILSFRTQKEGSDPDPIIPEAITGGSSSIGTTTATIECSYRNIPASAICGYEIYSASTTSFGDMRIVPLGCFEGVRTINLTDLLPGTTYYYNAYVDYNGKTYEGISYNFTTKRPSSEVEYVDNITSNSADIHLIYTDVPAGAECGIQCRSTTDEVKFLHIATVGYTDGKYNFPLDILEPDNEYIVTCYIKYNDMDFLGNEYTFSTKTPEAITGEVDNITSTSAICYASFLNVPENAKCYICIRYNEEGDINYVELSSGENQECKWENLESGKEYQYWAEIVYGEKHYFGEEKSFVTLDVPVELSNFTVLKSEWKRNGFDVNGQNYQFKYNCSVTATLKDATNIEDWGYAYMDPNGDIALISLLSQGNSFTDTRYSYCRNEDQATVILYGYVKYKDQEDITYGQGWEFPVAYEEEPSISFESAEITNIYAEPKYDGSGNYLFTWYTAGMRYVIKINGGYWIDYIQPIIYDNGSWSNNGGKTRVPGDGMYSVNTNLSYDNEANMNWSTGYRITLTDGSIIYTTNEIVVGGTPEQPTVSISTPYASAKKLSKKVIEQNSPSKNLHLPQFGELDFINQ